MILLFLEYFNLYSLVNFFSYLTVRTGFALFTSFLFILIFVPLLINKISKDKKNFQNNINFSLIDKIGSSIFYKKLNKSKVYKILQNI